MAHERAVAIPGYGVPEPRAPHMLIAHCTLVHRLCSNLWSKEEAD